MASLPETIARVLRTNPDSLIACHVAPDGDCLGAALALAIACEHVGNRALVGSSDGVPEAYRYLPRSDRIVSSPPAQRYSVGVAMECSSLERAGAFADALSKCSTLINIDHHLSNAGYGNIVYWDKSAAAVGEQVFGIIRAMGAPVTTEVAQCLLSAIVTDTGSFRYPNTSARTLRLAAELVDAGAAVHSVVERVYETRSAASLRLIGRALNHFTLSADGRIAWTVISLDTLRETGALPEDTTGIVGMLRQVRGVKVALLFEETPVGIRVGIRSRDQARANVIAESFGGGGHKGAAGFTLAGPVEEVIAKTLAVVERELAHG